MMFPAAFVLAVLLAVADGRPPKKGSAHGAQAVPVVEPEDHIKTCVEENARGCTQVYLHANGVACKYALSGRKIYESGARPTTLSSAEIKALRKYAEDAKVYHAKIKQWQKSSWPSRFNPFEMVKRTGSTDMPVMPTMPCFCRTCPNRPGGTKADDAQTASTELPGSTSPVVDLSTTGSPLADTSAVPTSTEEPAKTTTDMLVRHVTGAPVSASTNAPVSDATDEPLTDSTDEPQTGSSDEPVSPSSGKPNSGITDEPLLGTTDDEPSTGLTDEPFPASTDGFPFNDDPSNETTTAFPPGTTAQPPLATGGPLVGGTEEPSNSTSDEPLPGSTDGEQFTDTPVPASTDDFPFNDDPSNETASVVPSEATDQPPFSTDSLLVDETEDPSNGTSDWPLPGSTDDEQWTAEPVTASTDGFPFNDNPSNETTPAFPHETTAQPPLFTNSPFEGTDEPSNGTSDRPRNSTHEPVTDWTEDPLNGTNDAPSHNSTGVPLNGTYSSAPNATEDAPTQAWSTHAPSTVAWTEEPSTVQPLPNGTHLVVASNGTNSYSDAGPIKVNINVGINVSGGEELLTRMGSKVAQVLELLKSVH